MFRMEEILPGKDLKIKINLLSFKLNSVTMLASNHILKTALKENGKFYQVKVQGSIRMIQDFPLNVVNG